MISSLKKRLRKEAFITSPLSIVINPVYIIRNGLYKAISNITPNIKGNVLDFGCGSKPYESLFVNANSYVGVDIEVSGHNHKDSKVDYFYDGKKLPFNDASFDAIVCFEVFEHVFNIEEVLTEIHRVLKPNGQLLISIPFAWDEHEIPYDFARYTSFGITHILNKNNFEVVKLTKTTTYILTVFQMLIAYLCQYALPKGRLFGRISQLIFIFPLNVLALLLNTLLPKRYEYFCNNVVLAAKVEAKPVQPQL
ncbi:MAG: methyltransferase domain-containing protein [Candidatus Protistobacter heckmanni]|nr:methyltransferase domain-containing protein [Candidatus Protistobacter heckmanni]